MPQSDELLESEAARPARSALGSTPLLMAAIVLMSAAGSFGAVRAWFPKARTASSDAAPVRPATAPAATNISHGIARPESDTRTPSGRLSIVSDPAGARVEVDGRPRGVAPIVIDGLAAAEHHIKIVSDSGVAERTIAISNNVMTEVVFSLPKPAASAAAAPAAPIGGWLTIRSPFPVEMLEHDEVVGASGAAKIMLAAGTHHVQLRNEAVGFEATRTIAVTAGKVTAIEIEPPKATINVNARPWADVLVDGEMVGQTPLSGVSVTVGPHQIVFRNPQFGEMSQRVVVTARGVNRVAVDFKK